MVFRLGSCGAAGVMVFEGCLTVTPVSVSTRLLLSAARVVAAVVRIIQQSNEPANIFFTLVFLPIYLIVGEYQGRERALCLQRAATIVRLLAVSSVRKLSSAKDNERHNSYGDVMRRKTL